MRKTISNTFFILIIVSILILSGSLFYCFTRGQSPEILGYKLSTVTSGSMQPYIKTGSLIFIKEIEPIDLKVDDVITFTDSDNKVLTTHRIVDIVKENGELKFKTKGDANGTEDAGLVPSYAVIGKVDYKISYLGTIFAFLKSTEGKLVAFVLFLLLAMIIDLFKKKEKVTRENKKQSNCYIVSENGDLIVKQ